MIKRSRKPVVISIICIILCFSAIMIYIRASRKPPFKEGHFIYVSNSLDKYEYNSDNIKDINTAYHYIKSNLDGTNPRNIWVYICSPTRTETFIFHEGSKRRGVTDLLIAEYEKYTFMVNTISSYNIHPDGSRRLVSILNAEYNMLHMSIPLVPGWVFWIPNNYKIIPGHLPSFIYNFDLTDLGFMYRHIMDKDENIKIGIIGPGPGNRLVYSGKAELVYKGIVKVNNYETRKYRVSGEAFQDIYGKINFDRNEGFIVKIAMPLHNSPHFDSFLLNLKDRVCMSRKAWEEFVTVRTHQVLSR